jgi:hypothetical protein
MRETDEQKEARRISNLQIAASDMNMRGKCARCEGKYLTGHNVLDVTDSALGSISVHEHCVKKGDVVRACWSQTVVVDE